MKKIIATTLGILLLGPSQLSAQDFEWANSIGGGFGDFSNSVGIDENGSIISAGLFRDTVDFDPGPGADIHFSNGLDDFFIQKLDSSGDFLWAKTIGGAGTDVILGLAIDLANNVLVTGYYSGTVDFDPGPGIFNLTASGGTEAFVLKLDPFGDLLWVKTFSGGNNEVGFAITVDPDGNVYSTGHFSSTVDFNPGAGVFNLSSFGLSDIYISKLSSSGEFIWAKSAGGAQSDVGRSISIDISGNVLIAGEYQTTSDFDPGAPIFNMTAIQGIDIFILKLDSLGIFKWAKSLGGTSSERPNSITTDSKGNVITTGYFVGTADFDPGAGINNLTSAGGTEAFVSKLDSSGNFLWANSFAGSSSGEGTAIITDEFDNIFSVGLFNGTVDFLSGSGVKNLTSAGNSDAYISKLGSEGNFLGSWQFSGSSFVGAYGLAANSKGDLAISGRFYSIVDFDPSVGTSNRTSIGNDDVFTVKLKKAGSYPRILSISPKIGQVSSLVNLYGQNFNDSSSKNIVRFGGVKANVITGNDSSLVIAAPLGTTFKPITLDNNNGIGYFDPGFHLTFPGLSTLDHQSFNLDTSLLTGSNPHFTELADLDGDGHLDIICANDASNNISVFRNDGTGKFENPVYFNAQANTRDIAIGDIDQDGKLDIVAANIGPNNSISVFRNTSTIGTWNSTSLANPVNFSTGNDPSKVAIHDINMDGKPDIVTANWASNTISIFQSYVDPGLINTTDLVRTDLGTNVNPHQVQIADIDLDGLPEILVSNFTSGNFNVFQNNLTAGGLITSTGFTAWGYGTIAGCHGIGVGDLDGDGRPDLAVAGYNSGKLHLFRNLTTPDTIDGNAFAPEVQYPLVNGASSVAINDLDGDGKLDVSVAIHGSIYLSLFKNQGSVGTIDSTTLAGQVVLLSAGTPHDISIGDINGDTLPDLIVPHIGPNTISVFAQTPNRDKSFPPEIFSISPDTGRVGTSLTITGDHFDLNPANNIVTLGRINAVVNSSTVNSISCNVPIGTTQDALSIQTSAGEGFFEDAFIQTFKKKALNQNSFDQQLLYGVGAFPLFCEVGDLDGDGLLDMVVTNQNSNNLSIFRNNGSPENPSFEPSFNLSSPALPRGIKIKDMDADGKPEIVFVSYAAHLISIYKNNSLPGILNDTTFGNRIDINPNAPNPTYFNVEIADLDGDGISELITANEGANSITIFQRLSNSLTFSDPIRINLNCVSRPLHVTARDLDRDGKPDLIVSNFGASSISVFRNNSVPGVFHANSFEARVDIASEGSLHALSVADLNDDGFPELISGSWVTGRLSFFQNNCSPGTIASSSFQLTHRISGFNNPTSIAPSDLNGDGDLDLVVTNYGTNTLSILNRVSSATLLDSSTFDDPFNIPAQIQPHHIEIADMDGDSLPDILTVNASSSSLSLIRSVPDRPSPPNIISFSPESGPVGTLVTITGTNFSDTASKNRVWFGGTKGNVVSSTSTTIIVEVPFGATYEPISVQTVNGTAFSQKPFISTFSNADQIGQTSFEKSNLTTFSYSLTGTLADLDDDGKNDIVLDQSGINQVGTFHNTSAVGNLSFNSQNQLLGQFGPRGIAKVDLDGDGKLDLVVCQITQSTIKIYRNKGLPGNLSADSFDTPITIPAGGQPLWVESKDLDEDGKPDLVVANHTSNNLQVLKNTSKPGALNVSDFQISISLSTGGGSNPNRIEIGDVDGDNKPDLMVTNVSNNTVSIFRNTTQKGIINSFSFEPKFDLSTQSYPRDIGFGDLDSDGKPDIVVTNQVSNSISIFKNIGSPGAIDNNSFESRLDFLSEGIAPIPLEIFDLNGDGQLEIVYGNHGTATVGVMLNQSQLGTLDSSSFRFPVLYNVEPNPHDLAIADCDQDSLPEIVVFQNNSPLGISILKRLPDPPPPPIITSFSPTQGPIGSVVTISGENFNDTAANNKVLFGATEANVLSATTTSITCEVPFGATFEPLTVQTANGIGYAKEEFIPTFQKASGIRSNSFGNQINLPAGVGTYFHTMADLDGDGLTDVISSSQGTPHRISVYRNTGTANNPSFAPRVDFPVVLEPREISVGDLDGDGKPEIAVVNILGHNVSVFLNNSTPGVINGSSFATRHDFATGSQPSNVRIQDLDGDGKSDLVVSNWLSNTISVFKNRFQQGVIDNGSFFPRFDLPTGTNPHRLKIYDIDMDGKPEICFTNYNSGTLSIYPNKSTLDILTELSFGNRVDIPISTTPQEPSFGDLDNDGMPDLVIPSYNLDLFYVFRNQGSPGNINTSIFSNPISFSVPNGPNSIALTDLDGDGNLDVGVSNWDARVISLFNHSGSLAIDSSLFFPPVHYPLEQTHHLTFGDLDGDSLPDLITTSYSSNATSILFRKPNPAEPPRITGFSPELGPINSVVTISGQNFNDTLNNNVVYFGSTRANLLSGSVSSLVVEVPDGATWDPITVMTGTGTAYSSKPFHVVFSRAEGLNPTSYQSLPSLITDTNPYFCALGDLDGDGKSDIVAIHQSKTTLSVFRNTGTPGSPSFASRQDHFLSTQPRDVDIADIDQDGKMDLIVATHPVGNITIFRNTSTSGIWNSSSLAPPINLSTGSINFNVDIQDIDLDGKPDILVCVEGSDIIRIFKNDASPGAISPSDFPTSHAYATGPNPIHAYARDLDLDGKPDLVVSNWNANYISVYRNESNVGVINESTFTNRVDITAGDKPHGIGIGDFDKDGKPDLAVSSWNDNTLRILKNNSTPGILDINSFSMGTTIATGTNPTGLGVSDLDGDGHLDVALVNVNSQNMSLFRNTGSGQIDATLLEEGVLFATDQAPHDIAIGDLDGDSLPDIITSNAIGNTLSLFRRVLNPTPPIITSIAPSLGRIHSTVTISGSNFSDTIANNRVFFGGAKAPVLSASNNSLTVEAPIGTIFKPLTVQTAEGMGYSSEPFVPIFDRATGLSISSFDTKADGNAPGNPFEVELADFDGDGKLDVAYVALGSNQVVTALNNSTGNNVSFATGASLATNSNPIAIEIEDLDNDGKLDLVVANQASGNISVYKNTSTLGALSFSSKVDFASGTNPVSIAIQDLDFDGRPDIVVANEVSNTLSVFKNQTIKGLINSASFGSKVDLTTGSQPFSVAVGDVDGDGKPDLVSSDLSANTVSVFRSVVSSGLLNQTSFETRVPFATNLGPQNVKLGDIDQDGKPEIVVVNFTSDNVSVLKNNSSPGTINSSSFASQVSFSTGTNPFNLRIHDITGDGKPDIATVNNGAGSISLFENLGVPGIINSSTFSAKVDLGLNVNPHSIAIGDITGDSLPDLATTNFGSNNISYYKRLLNPCFDPTQPTLSFDKDTICKGESVVLRVTGGSLNSATNWHWYTGNCSINPVGVGDSITVIPDTSTTYFVRGEGGCVIPFTCSSRRLYVDDAPTQATAGFDIDSCATQVVLNANSISVGSGAWTQLSGAGALTFGNINDPNTLVDIIGFSSSSDTFLLEWTSINGVCPVSSDTVQLVYHQNPTVPLAGPDNQVCDSLVQLNGNPIAVGLGTWSEIGSSRINFSDPNISNPLANIAFGVGEASVSVSLAYTTSNGTCPSLEDTVDIVFNQAPDVPIAGPDDTICGLNYTMGANPISVGNATWSMISGPGILNFNNITDPNTGVTAALFGTYRIAWTNSNGICPAVYDSIDLEFVEPPSLSNAGIDQLLCDTVFQLAGNTPIVGSPSWAEIGTTRLNFSNAIDPNSTASLSFLPGEDSVVLNLQYQIANSICLIEYDTVQLTAYQSPGPSLAGPDQTICGDTAFLMGNIPMVGSGTWVPISTSGPFNIGNTNDPNTYLTALAQGIYELGWVHSNGTCPLSQDTVSISFDSPPSISIAGSDTSICGLSSFLNANLPGVGTGTWTQVSGPVGSVFSNINDPGSTIQVTTPGTYEYSWTISNGNCPDNSDTVSISFNLPPTVSAGNDTSICLGQPVVLSGSGANSYAWDQGVSNGVPFNPNTTSTYTVIGTGNGNCTDTASVTVTVNALPQPALGPDTVLCFDESISLDPGSGFSSYNWSTGAITQTIVVDSSAGVGTYWVQVTDNNQCSNTDSVFVDFTICTGIDLAGLGNTRIFPNPTREKLFIEFEQEVNAILHLIDEKGSIVIEERMEGKNKELNLEILTPGVYILRIQQNGYDYSIRVVKE